jgi:hypothetical protein
MGGIIMDKSKRVTIFNRKELLITMDMKHQANVRDILTANSIDYSVKVTNLQSRDVIGSSRAKIGSAGVDQKISYEYKIFVHKNEYDNALRLIK